MKLFFKITFALVLLLFIAIICFAVIFNPNDYKDEISKLAKEQTGRELLIQGDISLSLFPWIGLDLGAIEISNAKGFGKKPFAKMKHLQVRAKFWPLFEQRLEADTLVVEGLQLNLVKNKMGITNWDDLTKPSPKTNVDAAKKTPQPIMENNNQNTLAAFALNGIEIKQAQLTFHDHQKNINTSIKDITLSLGKLKPNTKIPFGLSFYFQEKTIEAKVNLKTNILFSSNFKQFSFYDTNLTSDLLPSELKQHFMPQIKSKLMQMDLEKQTFKTEKIELIQSNLKLHTKISTSQLFSKPIFDGFIKLHPFNPRTAMTEFKLSAPDMANKKAFTLMQAQLKIKGSLKSIDLSEIKIILDQTKITGGAKIKSAPHNSSVNLMVDNINIDRYLPAPSKNETENNKNSPEVALIPVALLAAFNLDAQLKIKKTQIKKTHWDEIQLASHSKNGHVEISPLTIKGYDSTIKANVNIDIVKNNALLSGNLNVKDIMAGKLFNDFTEKDKLKGKASVVISFNTSGTKVSQLKQNLNGKLKLNLKNGTFKGFDLEHQQRVLSAKLKGKTPPATPKPEETKIANLDATAVIKKGVLTNKDLRASTPFSRIIGKGTVDIPKEKLNYIASVKFTSSTEIKVNKPYEKMNVIPLDIIIGGTFDEPSIKPDFKKAVNQLVGNELKKQQQKLKKDFDKKLEAEKQKLKKEAEEKLKKNLNEGLKKLFKL